jgi:hypothetical protein
LPLGVPSQHAVENLFDLFLRHGGSILQALFGIEKRVRAGRRPGNIVQSNLPCSWSHCFNRLTLPRSSARAAIR